MFVQVTTLTALMYGVRYAIFPILAAAFVLAVFCLVWLVRSAGHHAGEDGITLTGWMACRLMCISDLRWWRRDFCF